MSEKTARQVRKETNKNYSSAFIQAMNVIQTRVQNQTFMQRFKTCYKYLVKKEFEI